MHRTIRCELHIAVSLDTSGEGPLVDGRAQVEHTIGSIPSDPQSTVLAFVKDGEICFGELTAGENTQENGEDDGHSAACVRILEANINSVNIGTQYFKEEWVIPRRTIPEEVARADIITGLSAPRTMTPRQWRSRDGKLGQPPWLIDSDAQILVSALRATMEMDES